MLWLQRFAEYLEYKRGIVVVSPHVSAIGNKAEQVYFALHKAARENKTLLLANPYDTPGRFRMRVVNRALLGVCAPGVHCVGKVGRVAAALLLSALYWPSRIIGTFWRKFTGLTPRNGYMVPEVGTLNLWQPSFVTDAFSWDIVERYRWRETIAQPLGVTLPMDIERLGRAALTRLGIPIDAQYACLHVRDGGFHGDFGEEHRNANITDYIPLISEITNRGIYVVRLGDSKMARLPPMVRVVDYPFTPEKSDAMDLFLIKHCAFYVGMQSGIFDIAVLFERPIVLTNMQSWLYPHPPKPTDLGVLRPVYCNERTRYLSISELLAEPWHSQHFNELSAQFEFHQNSPEELRACMSEYFDRDEICATDCQRTYNRIRIEKGRALISSPIIPADKFSDIHQRYRLASRLESAQGCICHSYLQDNWESSTRNQI